MKQRGIINLDGTYGDVTFYKTRDGYLARSKGGVSKERIKNDPKFVRVRENDKEFGEAASAGRLLRSTIAPLVKKAKDTRLISRLTQIMSKIIKFDATSPRGDRNVATAIAVADAKTLLKGFEFNIRSQLSSILLIPYTLNTTDGKVHIAGFNPVNDLNSPSGSTHLTLTSAFAIINFGTGAADIEYSDPVNLPIDNVAADADINPPGIPSGTGAKLYFLMIEFFQEVNGVQYSLNDGGFNALVITDVV